MDMPGIGGKAGTGGYDGTAGSLILARTFHAVGIVGITGFGKVKFCGIYGRGELGKAGVN